MEETTQRKGVRAMNQAKVKGVLEQQLKRLVEYSQKDCSVIEFCELNYRICHTLELLKMIDPPVNGGASKCECILGLNNLMCKPGGYGGGGI